MTQPDYSGELSYLAGVLTYRSADRNWSVPIAKVKLIAEYTNSDGPYLDDYFFVFLTAPENGWHEASFYAKGRDAVLAALTETLRTPIECGLCHSTEYQTRILWPPHLKGQELMEILPPQNHGFLYRLLHWGDKDIRLSAAARQAFDR